MHCASSKCNSVTGACSRCLNGYYLDGTTCKSCSTKSNCTKCSITSTKCLTCNAGYYPNTNGDCKTCSNIHCVSTKCNASNGTCSGCLNGYYLDGTSCKSCSLKSNCDKCSTTSTKCLTCKADYYPNTNGDCIKCNTISNCVSCQQDKEYCVICKEGYFMKDGQCFNCEKNNVRNCSTCSTSSEDCLTCRNELTLTNGYCTSLLNYIKFMTNSFRMYIE